MIFCLLISIIVANYSFIVDGTADKRIDDFIEDKEKTFEDYTKVSFS